MSLPSWPLYCNSFYYSFPNSQRALLQEIQNSLACAVVKACHITHILHSIHCLRIAEHTHTHTHTQPFYDSQVLSGTIWEMVPEETFTHSHLSWSSTILICFIQLIRSMASSRFSPRAWQSISTISLQVFFGLPVDLAPFTSYSIHFFTQSSSFFRNKCPYHHNLFCCSTETVI